MLHAYSQSGKLDDVKFVFDNMPVRNEVSWNTIITAYAQIGHFQETMALAAFDAMPERNVVSWTALLQAYAMIGDVALAIASFQRMPQCNLVSWTAMLTTLAQGGRLGDAKESKDIYDYVGRENVVAGNAMIQAYAQNGHLEKSQTIFHMMPLKNRTVFSWNALLVAYAQNGHARNGVILFRDMVLDGSCKPDDVSFASILSACGHAGRVRDAVEHFTGMISDHFVQPSCEHFHCMVSVLGRAGRLVEAESLIYSMPFVPDSIAWKTLLSCCRMYNDVERAEHAAECASALDLHASSSPFVLLGNLYTEELLGGVHSGMIDDDHQSLIIE
ncbi:hypothetical protein SELMODRAFT_106533 [Selaginella moellendorffii]|uniref:Pentacotripeptide-repeat region of PRORP domain-containing protein n=1 Tax=Selaginella moellendorffii TaxID=88036 RepID=D8S160_SELML|nr:hypothetical protein SELMODRAFT_106533 [Selaginella moellendorffii]